MKNMTLPAKSCSILLCALLLFAAGCKKDEPETFISDKARPTWTASGNHDMTSSMTAVVKVDLAAQETLLSAQMNEAANLYDGSRALIALYIALGGGFK